MLYAHSCAWKLNTVIATFCYSGQNRGHHRFGGDRRNGWRGQNAGEHRNGPHSDGPRRRRVRRAKQAAQSVAQIKRRAATCPGPGTDRITAVGLHNP
eukprot:366012-Chlamydomonas_euryale.AAC.13